MQVRCLEHSVPSTERHLGGAVATEAGIGFHWDKDENLAAAAHLHVHPFISTVGMYFSHRASSTLETRTRLLQFIVSVKAESNAGELNQM